MRKGKKIHTINVHGIDKPVKNTAAKLIQLLEGKAYDAYRNKDDRRAHLFWQQAEHYKKVQEAEESG